MSLEAGFSLRNVVATVKNDCTASCFVPDDTSPQTSLTSEACACYVGQLIAEQMEPAIPLQFPVCVTSILGATAKWWFVLWRKNLHENNTTYKFVGRGLNNPLKYLSGEYQCHFIY